MDIVIEERKIKYWTNGRENQGGGRMCFMFFLFFRILKVQLFFLIKEEYIKLVGPLGPRNLK